MESTQIVAAHKKASGITIPEVKKTKQALEALLMTAIETFEIETGMRVNGVNIGRIGGWNCGDMQGSVSGVSLQVVVA
jgi:hypothetical protein